MDRGELVPDEVTDAMVEQRLSLAGARAGFILDNLIAAKKATTAFLPAMRMVFSFAWTWRLSFSTPANSMIARISSAC